MKISLNLIKKFINIEDDLMVSEHLTMIGHEVENVTELLFDKIVVGKLLKVEKHPNADKLTVCSVDIGEEVTIVCGARNHKAGDFVAVALPGAFIKGHLIKESDFRGVLSQGMLCSETELNISDASEGIMILEDVEVGSSLNKYFKDTIFNLSITPNRPDVLAHLGVARELAAKYSNKLRELDRVKLTFKSENFPCEIYKSIYLKDVNIKGSSKEIQKYLKLFNNKIINNFVDVSNFVMYELGQPSHMFDADKITGSLKVAYADPTTVVGLDGEEYKLDKNDLVIKDDEKIVAIAGIIGCANSSVDENTKNIILEVARFDPDTIRRTSKKLNLSTEASYRFERGVREDIEVVCKRILSLLEDSYGGYKELNSHRQIVIRDAIKFDYNEMNKILGTSISESEANKILKSLDIEVSNSKAIAPDFRSDLNREVDIYEEIARIYGYENIPYTMPTIEIRSFDKEKSLKNTLAALGLNEVINYSFVPEGYGSKKLLNPIIEDFAVMRDSMMFSMLKSVAYNLNNGKKKVEIFEVGKVYQEVEKNKIAIALTGTLDKSIYSEKRDIDFYDAKGILDTLAGEMYWNLSLGAQVIKDLHPGRSAIILKEGKVVGYIGEVHPDFAGNFGIKKRVYYIEMDVLPQDTYSISNISKYPAVERELSMLFSEDIEAGKVVKELCTNNLIKEYEIVDIYKGNFKGKKSIAFKFVIQSNKKTLSLDEINSVVDEVVEKSKKYDAEVRS